jgi:Sporulation and spore germination
VKIVLGVLGVLAVLSGCQRSTPETAERSTETVRKARVYLIADPSEENCGGTTAPYEVELGSPSPALGGTVEALLALGDRSDGSGFYNALAHSPLKIQRMERSGPVVRFYLTGYLELGGECDAPRVLSQLTETATQFSDVETAEFFLDGKPLEELLSGRG